MLVSLERLEFFGDSLTTRHAKCVLQGLPSLTHVKLGLNTCSIFREPELNSSACTPAMPGSLRWLSVTNTLIKTLLDESARECLKHSPGLEYLILPLYHYPKGELYAWIKGARCVRISGNDIEETEPLWWRNAYSI